MGFKLGLACVEEGLRTFGELCTPFMVLNLHTSPSNDLNHSFGVVGWERLKSYDREDFE